MDAAVHSVEKPVIVGGKDKSGPTVLIDFPHQVDDEIGIPRVEVGGWLIGDDESGIGHEGTGHGDPLLLPAAHFLRAMVHTVTQLDFFEEPLGKTRGLFLPYPADLEWQHYVLERREHGDEVEVLKDKPYRGIPQLAATSISQTRGDLPADDNFTRGGDIEKTYKIAQGRLPRAGRTPNRDKLVFPDLEADFAKRVYLGVAEVIGFPEI